MTIKKLYRGFSTSNYLNNRSLAIYDVDVVKEDIVNHIYTRLTERINIPSFGTLIPDITFEPLDQITTSIIREELIKVINYDPRVSLKSINISPINDVNGLEVSVDVYYIELNMTGSIDFTLNFD